MSWQVTRCGFESLSLGNSSSVSSCCEQQLFGPVSFPDLLTSGLYPLRDVPHVVLRPEVLEVGEEVDDVVAPDEMVRLLLEPTEVVLKTS